MNSFFRPSISRPRTGFLLAAICLAFTGDAAFGHWPLETQSIGCNGNLPVSQLDGRIDRQVRRTDLGADAELAPGSHRTPDILGVRVGNWAPNDATTSLFDGCWFGSGAFVRIEIAFDGLQNPPGRVGLLTPDHAPFEYGPHPVSGFIEIDVDDNVDSGGNVNNPENSYVGNIARFGGLPQNPELHDRIAKSGVEIGNFVGAGPFVERNGEDFHLALFGDLINSTTEQAGDGDNVFEAGEAWRIRGKLFHRAHGYTIFSGANGNGEYEPIVDVEFRHSIGNDVTVISLVFPLTNAAAAIADGNGVQSPDGNSANQSSIQEALLDLHSSVLNLNPQLRDHPAFPLIAPWETQNPSSYLDATQWRITCHVGMSPAAQDIAGAFITWTDAYPSATLGDFNGDGFVTALDLAEFDLFVQQHDGLPPYDIDNAINGRVTLQDFGPNFSMFDVNNDGVVDDDDFDAIPLDGDINKDRVVDLLDADAFTSILVGAAPPPSACSASNTSVGACCNEAPFGPDLCFDGTESDCLNQGGVFQGAGTSCVTNGCTFPVGACCTSGFGAPTTVCFDATLSDCIQVAGTFLGTNTQCGDPNLTCESFINIGACCFNSPASPCQQMSPQNCQNLSGAFQGIGTQCSDPQIGCTTPTDPVYCCSPFAGCLMIDMNDCVNQGGIPFPEATSCQETGCPSPNANGACCLSNGGALTCVDTTSASCFQLGGSFLGGSTTCANAQCGSIALRACCIPGFGCRELPTFECVVSGGVPEPVGVECTPNSCLIGGATIGACCVSIPGIIGEQCVRLSDQECAIQGGAFSGFGSQCGTSAVPCQNPLSPLLSPPEFVDILLGRVTDPTAIASADYNEDGSADGLDIPLFIDSLTGISFASTGACCLTGFAQSAICFIASEANCTSIGGMFGGGGSSCTNNSCSIPESISVACCLPVGCSDMTPSDCAASGGTSDPDALGCAQRAVRSRLQVCDMNHDDRLNGLDIQAFVERLLED